MPGVASLAAALDLLDLSAGPSHPVIWGRAQFHLQSSSASDSEGQQAPDDLDRYQDDLYDKGNYQAGKKHAVRASERVSPQTLLAHRYLTPALPPFYAR